MRNVENQRSRIVAAFVIFNLLDDLFSAISNVLGSIAGFFKSAAISFRFIQYDQARKYEDLTGGDFGKVIGCPGHYRGECSHAEAADDDDD